MDLDLEVILLGEETVNDVIDEERRQGLQGVVIFLQKFEHVLKVATSHDFSDKSDYNRVSSWCHIAIWLFLLVIQNDPIAKSKLVLLWELLECPVVIRHVMKHPD